MLVMMKMQEQLNSFTRGNNKISSTVQNEQEYVVPISTPISSHPSNIMNFDPEPWEYDDYMSVIHIILSLHFVDN